MHPDEYENLGDGYSSESQRCFAEAQMLRPVQNDRQKALDLAASGKFVMVSQGEVCCRATDALVGVSYSVTGVFETEAEAIAALHGNSEEWDQYILRPEFVRETLLKMNCDKCHGSEVPDDCPF